MFIINIFTLVIFVYKYIGKLINYYWLHNYWKLQKKFKDSLEFNTWPYIKLNLNNILRVIALKVILLKMKASMSHKGSVKIFEKYLRYIYGYNFTRYLLKTMHQKENKWE